MALSREIRKKALAEMLAGMSRDECAEKYMCLREELSGEAKTALRIRAAQANRGLTQVESELPENKSLSALGFEKARELIPFVGSPRDFKDWAQGLESVMGVATAEVAMAKGTDTLDDASDIRDRFRERILALSERQKIEPVNVVDGEARVVDPGRLKGVEGAA